MERLDEAGVGQRHGYGLEERWLRREGIVAGMGASWHPGRTGCEGLAGSSVSSLSEYIKRESWSRSPVAFLLMGRQRD